MTKIIDVEKDNFENVFHLCEKLEAMNILFFNDPDLQLSDEEKSFLHTYENQFSKKIIFHPDNQDLSSVLGKKKDPIFPLLKKMAQNIETFLSVSLSPYALGLQKESICIHGAKAISSQERSLQTCISAKPLHGNRILQFFINLDPENDYRWTTADDFKLLLEKYGKNSSLPFPSFGTKPIYEKTEKNLKKLLQKIKINTPALSPYDMFMKKLSHFLRKNDNFQTESQKHYWDFPQNSAWLAFTDAISHCPVVEGKVLEMTFTLSKTSLLNPEIAPLSLLERFSNEIMLEPKYMHFDQ